MRKSSPPAQIIQGLESGIECLLHIVSSNQPVGCRELARKLNMETTRVNRILGTLAYMGMAAQTPDKKYIPGSGINILAALAMRSSPLLKIALPHLKSMSQRLNKEVSLGVLWNDKVCYLYHGMDETYAAITEHRLYPAQDSSIGQCLLAFESDEEIKRIFPDSPDLLKNIRKVRKDGYARGKHSSVAVCIGGNLQLGGLAVNELKDEELSNDIVETLNSYANTIAGEWHSINRRS